MAFMFWHLASAPFAAAATVPDMLGRRVSIPDGPIRLVTLAPSLTEIVFALGRQDWLVGVTDFCDFPPAARSKPKIGGSMTPNLERIVQVRPDVALATAEGNSLDTVANLTRLGVSVFTVKPEGYAGVMASIRVLGSLLRAEGIADSLLQEIQGKVDAVRGAVRARPRHRVLYLLWTHPLIAAGPASYIHDLLEMAGGENVVRERAIAYPRLSWEQVIGWGPEVILVAAHREGEDRPLTQELRSAWQAVPAVRNGRLVSVSGDPVHRPGPRLADGLALLARAIHPEAFVARPAPGRTQAHRP